MRVRHPRVIKRRTHFIGVVAFAHVGVFLHPPAWLPKQHMLRIKRCAQRATGVTRSRLNKNLLKWKLTQQPSIGNTVQRHSARQA